MSKLQQARATLFPLTENHIPSVVDIHSKAFVGYMSTKLGKPYLSHFYRWFSMRTDAISFVAKDSFHVVGFIVGAPLGYETIMGRNLFWVAAGSILVRPWLLIGKDIRSAIFDRGLIIFGKRPRRKEYPILPEPTMSLVGIGVSPQDQGLGVGKSLLQAFEKKALEMNMRSMRLSVYPENQVARRLYESIGWQAFSGLVLPGQAMYYSKVLA
jgi:ribosomal protein S18 acetylase RimI-like enzyme